MTLYPPAFVEALTGDTAITYHAQDYRRLISALAPVPGTVNAGDLMVSQRAAGANMSVDVAAGRAFVAGTSIARQGTYLVESDTVTNVPIQTANASNPRWDAIVAKVYDKQADGGSQYVWTPMAIAGTPAAAPIAPATPASSLLLAYVYVAANATSIANAIVNDRRVLSGRGDVPKWDMANTTNPAQALNSNTSVAYVPGGRFQTIGVLWDPTIARVTILTPGRYVVDFSCRLSASASAGPRTVYLTLYTSDGVTIGRQKANTVVSSTREPMSVSGTMYLTAGQMVQANLYQNTGQTLSVDDTFLEPNFTGVWLGP